MDETRGRLAAGLLDGIGGCGSYEWHVGPNGLAWSPGLSRLYGIDRPPGSEGGFLDLVHPDDRVRVEAETLGFLEAGDTYEHEFRILRPDGEVRLIHDRGTIERGPDGAARVLRGINIDVTAQRPAELAALSAQAPPTIGIGFYDYDVARQRSWWSEDTCRILGVPAAAAATGLTAALRECLHEDDRARLLAQVEIASRQPGPFEIEYRIRDGDGAIRWIRDRGEAFGPLDPETGRTARVRGTITDITEHKRRGNVAPAGYDTYRRIIESAPFGIMLLDSELRFVEASASARRVFAAAGSLIGTPLDTALHAIWPDDFADEVMARFREVVATGVPYHSAQTSERRRDLGTEQVYEWSLEQIRLPDGSAGVACYFHDLTERLATETAARANEQRLELAYDAAGIGAWDLDLDTGQAVWSPQLYALLGLPADRPASADLLFAHVHPEDTGRLRAEMDRAIATGEVLETAFRVNRTNGETRHFAARGRVVEYRDGRAARMIGVNFDVTERRRMERQVRAQEQRLRLVIDNALAFIGVLDTDGTLREANETALAAGGLARDDVIGKRFWETHWWNHDPAVAKRLRDAVETAAGGSPVRWDAVVRMAGDTRMTIDVLLSPVLGPDGKVHEIVASGFDITDRIAAIERAEILTREINHRAKNTIAMVQAIARQIWRAGREDFFDRFDARLAALARAHDLLVKDGWDRALIGDLARGQLAHFEHLVGSRIHLDGDDLAVTAEAAQTLGMAFHELATNAGKYGALSTETGEVRIAWGRRQDADGRGMLAVSWTETGGPAPAAPERRGFGTVVLGSLIQATLSAEGGSEYRPEGLRWHILCPDSCVLG